jgi:hypothetical protein
MIRAEKDFKFQIRTRAARRTGTTLEADICYSRFAVAAHPKATPVAIASSSSISPTIVAALPSIRIRFTPSARSRKPALQASRAFCAFERSIPETTIHLGLEESRDPELSSPTRLEMGAELAVEYLTGAGPP